MKSYRTEQMCKRMMLLQSEFSLEREGKQVITLQESWIIAEPFQKKT